MATPIMTAAIVTTDWVAEHATDTGVRVVEVDVDTTAYDQGHVPGAAGSNWTSERAPDLSLRAFLPEVQKAMQTKSAVLVDVRSPEEFTGAILAPPGLPETRQRGGHIPGAKSIRWAKACNEDATSKSHDELEALNGAQGVTSDKLVIAYCRIDERSSHTWLVLKHLLGFDTVKNYDGSWAEWGNLVGAPIEKPSTTKGGCMSRRLGILSALAVLLIVVAGHAAGQEKKTTSPADGHTVHVIAPHVVAGKVMGPYHHYCKVLSPEPVIECLCYESADPGARLEQVEYIIAKSITRTGAVSLANWNKNWHDHTQEIATGRVQVLDLPPDKAKEVADLVATTDGIIFHLWSHDEKLPSGEVIIAQSVGHMKLKEADFRKGAPQK